MTEHDPDMILEDAHDGQALKAIAAERWAISEEGLAQIIAIATRTHDVTPEALAKFEGRPAGAYSEIRGDVGVLNVHGPMFRHANLFTQMSGATSTEAVAKEFGRLEADPAVSRIVMDIASPGGMVEGTSGLASIIKASAKPVTAFVSGDAQSAAYWVASAAEKIVVADTAKLGSIGVVGSYRRAPGRKGAIEIDIVSSQSPRKRPDPTTDEGRTQIQEEVDALADVFISAVAANRGVDADRVVHDFGRGGTLIGRNAVQAGMADAVGTFESVVAGRAGTQQGEAQTMAEEKTPEITRDFIAAEHPDIAEAFRREGSEVSLGELADAKADAATAERERIQAVLAMSMPGHEDLVQSLAFDGKTTGPEAAVQILSAEKAAQNGMRETLRAEGKDVVRSAEAGAGKTTDNTADLPLDERCKVAWEKDAELRASFGDDFDRYLAFERANERGQVRQLHDRSA